MYPYFQHIPLGKSIPLNNPHAVSVSLPTMNDVIGYEENDHAVLCRMQSGYPRFFRNKLVEKLTDFLREKHQIPGSAELLPLMSYGSLEVVKRKFGDTVRFIEEGDCVFLVMAKDDIQLQPIKDFIRNGGILLSSRKAEDMLFPLGLISGKHSEELFEGHDASNAIRTNLCRAYGAESSENVFLCSSGMNAVYAVIEGLMDYTANSERQTILQAGWLYLDTLEIIRKSGRPGILVTSATDINRLEERIIAEHESIGAVFTEVPNNPLLECVDLPRLYEICRQFEIPLIVDSTIGTPYNLNILSHCDIAVESLTKFACGQGDVLMGAVIFNPASRIAGALRKNILSNIIPPYSRDVSRLAKSIEGYEERVRIISENTMQLIRHLEKSPVVTRVYSVLHPDSCLNFAKIRRHADALPGLISVVFDKELAFYYDMLNLPKGPSLGTEFTLAMPYVYLAHYDQVKTLAGRAALEQMGLHPELLRISVGIEPPEEIISVFKAAGI